MVDPVFIGDTPIGGDAPTYVIAEAGINHNGSLQLAKRLVDVAAEADADAVKFQKRSLERTYLDPILENPARAEMGVEHTVSNLKKVTLSDEQFRELAAYTRESDVEFLCSPWDDRSVDFLEELAVPAYKIGSPDMTNFVLLERLFETGKPLLLSTGMAQEREIARTVGFLEEHDCEYALLHCRSTYPAPFHNLDLRFIDELRERYDVPVGYSGHERGIAVSTAAAALGAAVLERHVTLSRDMDGPDHAASLEPTGLEKQVRDIRNVEKSMGTPQGYLTRGEYINRRSLAKSLVATRTIEIGETIRREDLTAKSPAKGIPTQELYAVVGETARERIEAETFLEWADLEDPGLTEYEIPLDNWGVVVRFSDIGEHDWGDPGVFEFRVNGADLDQRFDLDEYEKRLGIHAPEQVGHDIVDVSARDEASRQWAVEIVQQVIDLTRDEIAPHFETEEPPIVVHPGGITRDHMQLESVDEFDAALERSLAELDDGSPTPVRKTVRDTSTTKIRSLKIVRHTTNRGANVARNTGIRESTGEYVAFLDDDDLWRPEKAERVVTAFESAGPEVGVVYTGTHYERGDTTLEARPTYEGDVLRELLAGKRFGQFSSIAVRATVIDEAGLPDESFPVWQDREWLFRLAQCCEFKPIPEPLTVRRIAHDDRIGYRFEEKRDVAYPRFVEKHYPLAREQGWYYARTFIASLNVGLGTTAINCGRYREARRAFLKAFLSNPAFQQTYFYLFASLLGKWSYKPSQYLKRKIPLPKNA